MATNLEEARGKDIVVRFDTQRCIHARHCVLGHPEVFQANMQGPWIDPEAASAERTAAVVQTCPSGALSFERLDGGLTQRRPRRLFRPEREMAPPYLLWSRLGLQKVVLLDGPKNALSNCSMRWGDRRRGRSAQK